MTRRAMPQRRLRTGSGGLGTAVAALLALALFAMPGNARADGQSDASERNKGARTVVGAMDSIACSKAAANSLLDDESIAACDRALSTERLSRANRIATLTNRGALHLRRREAEQALADFDAIIALEARHAEAHLNRGAALVMLRRPGPAVASITTALTYGVSAPHKAYFNRAAAREAMGDVRGAYEDYNTALTIVPDWGAAEAELSRFARGRRERLAAQLSETAPGGTP